jgi:Gp157 protein
VKRIDPNIVRAQVAALMAEFPELADDEELRVCTIEGETPVFDLLTAVLDDIRGAFTMQQAIDRRLEELRTRKERFARREEACRKIAHKLMEAADLRKAVLPDATLSIRPGPQSVRLIHPDFIPDQFWRVKREPSLSAIKAALKGGNDVPGATLTNAADILAIFTK